MAFTREEVEAELRARNYDVQPALAPMKPEIITPDMVIPVIPEIPQIQVPPVQFPPVEIPYQPPEGIGFGLDALFQNKWFWIGALGFIFLFYSQGKEGAQEPERYELVEEKIEEEEYLPETD